LIIILEIENLYNPKAPWILYLVNSLIALSLFFINVHYIIENNKIVIIEESTGRPASGKRWDSGIHRAIEAKENVAINAETEIISSMTYRDLFFTLY